MRPNRTALTTTITVGCLLVFGCEAGKSDDPYRAGDGTGGNGGNGGDGSGGTAGDGDGDTTGGGGAATGGGDGDGDGDMSFDPNDPFGPATAGGDRRNAVVAGQLCERLSTIQCAGEALCCSDAGRLYPACKSEMLAGCRNELLLDSIAMEGKAGFDPAHAEAAFTEFERLASQCDPTITAWGSSLDGLRGMLKGTALEGSNCAPDGLPNPSKVQGGTALVSCRNTATHACLPSDVTLTPIPRTMSRCEPRSGNGGVCYSDANCTEGLFCDNPDYDTEYTAECKPRLGNGTSCSQASRCQSLICKSGVCVAADQQTAYCLAD